MPNNKNILREKINEACPELLKLEFGCQVKVVDYSGFGLIGKDSDNRELLESFDGYATIISYDIDYSPRDYDGAPDREDIVHFKLLVEGCYVELVDNICEDYIEILGKPPTLEHLLRTIDYADIYFEIGNPLKRVESLYEIEIMVMYGDVKDSFKYDLTKPPLEQSEEVIEALLKIINA